MYYFPFILVFLLSFITTLILTPVVKKIAVYHKIMDQPGKRKIHQKPIPRIGGLAVYFGIILSIYAIIAYPYFVDVEIKMLNFIGIIIGSTIVMLMGLYDDIKELSPISKLFWQIIAALITVYFGINIHFIANPFNQQIFYLTPWMTVLFSVGWIVVVTNSINLIDGLDGLATGICIIASLAMFIIALSQSMLSSALILMALFATCLAFLRFNYNPAQIFLGDSGSLLLGYILAVTSIMGVLKTSLLVALIIPIIILGIPIFDTIFSVVRRVKNKKHIFHADDQHLHHRLLAGGWSPKKVVVFIYLTCVVLALLALIVSWANNIQATIISIVAIIMIILIYLIIRAGNKVIKGID